MRLPCRTAFALPESLFLLLLQLYSIIWVIFNRIIRKIISLKNGN